jgi:hypothetical protein
MMSILQSVQDDSSRIAWVPGLKDYRAGWSFQDAPSDGAKTKTAMGVAAFCYISDTASRKVLA